MNKMLVPGLLMAAVLSVQASTVLGPWVPVFKGIDHAVGSNAPDGGGMPNEFPAVSFLRHEDESFSDRIFEMSPAPFLQCRG